MQASCSKSFHRRLRIWTFATSVFYFTLFYYI
uniref:Uncharacterized protein n=1 Tax=Anguilla anguilla TaxID=7936 RepID=A0A0E9PZ53_ANGAN